MSSPPFEERALAEEELRTQREEIARLRAQVEDPGTWGVRVLDGLPVAVLLADENSTVLHANRASGQLLHVPHMLMFGKPLTVFVSLGSRPVFRRTWSEVVRSGGEHWLDVKLRSHTATNVPVHLGLSAQPELSTMRRVRCVAVPCGVPDRPGHVDGRAGHDDTEGSAYVRLARAMAELACLPGTSPDQSGLLTRAAAAAARAVPGAVGAGVSLRAATPGAVAGVAPAVCSSPASGAAEALQRELGQGPTYETARTGRVLVCENVRSDPRWPAFGRRVAAHGLGAVAAVPLVRGDEALGVLTVWAKPEALPAGCDALVRAVGQACASAVSLFRGNPSAR